MKTLSLTVLFLLVGGIIYWQRSVVAAHRDAERAFLWHDTLMRHLPPGLDTSLVLYNDKSQPLYFRQYVQKLFDMEGSFHLDSGIWRFSEFDGRRFLPIKTAVVLDRQTRFSSLMERLNKAAQIANQITVYKSKRRLDLERSGKIALSLPIELGKDPVGDKVREGDGKTPEGTYVIDYGAPKKLYYYAFGISYPNASDLEEAKKLGVDPGTGILIHGTRSGLKKTKDWTAGCIAVSNSDMDSLIKYVTGGTKITILK
jgi:lipoprotein-anchoring transpeptidase ErfK/SrfK